MKRRLFTILSALSLALCLATPVLWLRSARVTDDVRLRFSRHVDSVTCRTIGLGSSCGRIWAEWSDRYFVNMGGAEWRWEAESAQPSAPWSTSGWGFATFGDDDRWIDRVFVPHWLLGIAFSALPGFWFWQRWKAKRRCGLGLCRICGYDLRASPERCPECGTPINQPSDTGTNAA